MADAENALRICYAKQARTNCAKVTGWRREAMLARGLKPGVRQQISTDPNYTLGRPVSRLNGSWIIDSILITRSPSIQLRDRYTLNFAYLTHTCTSAFAFIINLRFFRCLQLHGEIGLRNLTSNAFMRCLHWYTLDWTAIPTAGNVCCTSYKLNFH